MRYETTDSTITDKAEGVSAKTITTSSYHRHIYATTSQKTAASASIARSLRALILTTSPQLYLKELGDNDFDDLDLQPESSWGMDLGYEYRLGKSGVVGINVFYRDVTDLIEIANTGQQGSEGDGTLFCNAQHR